MLKTPLCDLFGVEVPVILAPMGTRTSAELAAPANEGGLGGIGTLFRTTAAIKRDIDIVKKLTNRHFAINHIHKHWTLRRFVTRWKLGRP